MPKNKLLIFGALAIAAALGLVIFLLTSGAGGDGRQVKLPDHEFENWNQPLSDQAALANEAQSLFDEADLWTFEKLIEMARTGRISLVSELWRLRRKCPPAMTRYDCNIRIKQFLLSRYKPPGNERLTDLLLKYLRYEEIMSTYQIDQTDPAKRYEIIRGKRRELFGTEDARLMFGLEEARYEFRSRVKEFVARTKDMPGDRRVAGYEALRKQVYGDYYVAVVENEPKFTRYDTEVNLREADFRGLSADKRSAAVGALRTKYFGAPGAERMAKLDREVAEEAAAEKKYAEAKQVLAAENLNDSQREARLQQLRVKYFGREGAEEFARREKHQELLDSQKKR